MADGLPPRAGFLLKGGGNLPKKDSVSGRRRRLVRSGAIAVLLAVVPAGAAETLVEHAVAGTEERHADDHGVRAEEESGASAVGDAFGDAADLGSLRGRQLAQPVVGMAGTRSGGGYWLVAGDGGIFSFGDAAFHGSTGNIRLNQPIVGMAATPTGGGYWFVAADGGVFSFGDAVFRGSTGNLRLTRPIVGMAATPSGRGYWLVAADGGIFSFGDAAFHGSTGNIRLNQRVVGMASTPSGRGYWLVAADGGVFTFGDARPLGSAAGRPGAGVTGMAVTTTGSGYWLAGRDGAVHTFGDAASFGTGATPSPVVGMARTATGRGYWLVTSDGAVLNRVAAAPSGAYDFLARNRDGGPMRYDPCREIRYVVNPDGAPAGSVDEIHEAFRGLASVTGLRFRYAGPTTETHLPIGGTQRRRSYQPERYGEGNWAPILVSWVSERDEPVLAGNTLGYGGSTSYWLSSSDQAYVTGELVLDRDLGLLRPGFGAGLTRGNLFLHELGHVIGLDHVDDRSQLMYPTISDRSPADWGAGDRLGLRQLGTASGCLRVASPLGGLLPR
jgi:hypothetical protein